MKLKNLIQSTILLSIGLILHTLVPASIGFMKPDFLLALFFVALFNLESIQEVFVISFVCALFAAFTTSMPGGEFANIIDKLITGPLVYFSYNIVQNFPNRRVYITIITALGTFVSGMIFIFVIQVLGRLSIPMSMLILGAVIPAVLANTLIVLGIDKVTRRLPMKIS